MKLWIVGKSVGPRGEEWEFQGVFDSKKKAISACKSDRYFIGPAMLNEELPEKPEEWPGCYYPLYKEVK